MMLQSGANVLGAPTDFFFLFIFILHLSVFSNLSPLKIDYSYLRPRLYFTLFNFTNCTALKVDSLEEKKGRKKSL